MQTDFSIRLATNEDVAEVYAMAYELAEQQGILERFCATEHSLLKMVTDPKETTTTLVATHLEEIIGFAMFTLLKNNRLYHHGYAMYIDELFVKAKHRGKGLGTALFRYIAKEALTKECNRLEWWVTEGNEGATKFYKNIGAYPLTEMTTYRFKKPDLERFSEQY